MCFKVVVEDLVEVDRLLFEDAGGHLDPGVPERLYALSGHQRVHIQGGDENASDALLDDDLGARRRPSIMTAGFECHVEVRAGGVLFTAEKRIAFRVVLPDFLVVPLTDDAAVFDHDAADHRVRAHMPFPALRQLQRPPHIFFMGHIVIFFHRFAENLSPRQNPRSPQPFGSLTAQGAAKSRLETPDFGSQTVFCFSLWWFEAKVSPKENRGLPRIPLMVNTLSGRTDLRRRGKLLQERP